MKNLLGAFGNWYHKKIKITKVIPGIKYGA
jgi:hypothetical protein